MSIPPFTLQLIKSFNMKKDTTLTIRPHYDGFSWVYDDVQLAANHTLHLKVTEAVVARLETFLDLLNLDDDPIEAIQMNAPGFPAVLFDLPVSNHARETILRTFRQVAAAWPDTELKKRAPAVRFNAQPNSAEPAAPVVSEDERDEEMPPLLSSGNGYNTHLRW